LLTFVKQQIRNHCNVNYVFLYWENTCLILEDLTLRKDEKIFATLLPRRKNYNAFLILWTIWLCHLLFASDWNRFNYVDYGSSDAICHTWLLYMEAFGSNILIRSPVRDSWDFFLRFDHMNPSNHGAIYAWGPKWSHIFLVL
jgi:hypothetical protein